MKKVFFLDNSQNEREIGYAISDAAAWDIIHRFLLNHNYQSYYVRQWEEDGKHWYDVGSHTEFFFTKEI